MFHGMLILMCPDQFYKTLKQSVFIIYLYIYNGV